MRVLIDGQPAAGVELIRDYGSHRRVWQRIGDDGMLFGQHRLEALLEEKHAHLELNGRRLHVQGWSYRRKELMVWRGSRVVEGRVVDSNGRGVPFVGLGVGYGEALGIAATRTDAGGRFRLDSVTPSRQAITLLTDEWLRWADHTTIPESEEATEITLVTQPAVQVRVRVVASSGHPGAGVAVKASYRSPLRPDAKWEEVTTRADGHGIATLPVPKTGRFWVSGHGDTGWGRVHIRASARPAEIPVYLHPRGMKPSAWIPVEDPRIGDSGLRAPRIYVWPLDRPWEEPRAVEAHVATAQDGTRVWDLAGLRPGPYRVQIGAEGWAPARVDAHATVAGTWPPPRVTPERAKLARLRLRVTGPDGRPLEGAYLEVRAVDDDDPFRPRDTVGGWHGYPRADRELPIPAGSYYVRVMPFRKLKARSDWVRAEAPGERVTLVARPIAR